jgi:hypothetical protein
MTRLDTLILSFDPGQNSDSFTGFTAALWVQPMLASDTLSNIWDGPSESALPMWMKYQSGPDSVINTPFQAGGAGGAACHHTPDGGRVIRMVQAVAYADSTPVEAGKIYGLARFIIRQPAMSPGCMQPVCIEFRSSVLSTIGGRHRPVEATGVGVSLNAPAGKQCFESIVPASSAAKPK